MRVNNKRKLIAEVLLMQLLALYKYGVPLSKLIKSNALVISPPHLKKLLFIYIDILDSELDEELCEALSKSIFPTWLDNDTEVMTQPEEWNYKGKFPFGTWENNNV